MSPVSCGWRYISLSSPLDVPSLPSPFCSNDSRTLSTLRGNRSRTLQMRRHFDSKEQWLAEYIGKETGSEGSKKKLGSLGPSPPFPRLRWPRRLRREGHIQVFHAFYQILWRSRHCIKTQTFASVFRHQCSSPDIYRFGQKLFQVIIKNFRDTSFMNT